MNFLKLQEQENSKLDSEIAFNVGISIFLVIFFLVFIIYFAIVDNVPVKVTVFNFILSMTTVYLSHKLRNSNIKKTISKRVVTMIAESLHLQEREIDCSLIEIQKLGIHGFIFTYQKFKLLYTTYDDSLKEIVDEII